MDIQTKGRGTVLKLNSNSSPHLTDRSMILKVRTLISSRRRNATTFQATTVKAPSGVRTLQQHTALQHTHRGRAWRGWSTTEGTVSTGLFPPTFIMHIGVCSAKVMFQRQKGEELIQSQKAFSSLRLQISGEAGLSGKGQVCSQCHSVFSWVEGLMAVAQKRARKGSARTTRRNPEPTLSSQGKH